MIDLLKKLDIPVKDLSRAGTDNDAREVPPQGAIFHTPGRTFVTKQREKLAKPTDKKVEEACAKAFDALKYRSNILIGYTKVFLLDALDHRPMHAGTLKASVYARDWRTWAKPLGGNGWEQHGRDGHVVYDWWDKVYGHRSNPTKVFPWGGVPNNCIGIDLLPDQGGNFNDFQHFTALVLIRALADKYGWPIDNLHFVTHSFASPCERGTIKRRGMVVGTPWDLPPNKWAPDLEGAKFIDLENRVCVGDQVQSAT